METDKGFENFFNNIGSRKLRDRGKTVLLLLACLLLAGCGKEMGEEEQRAEISADSSANSNIDSNSTDIDSTDNSIDSKEKDIVVRETAENRSIQTEIMSGDFSRLDEDDEFKEHLERAFARWESGETLEIEWQMLDLNGDGIEDLIVQNKETVGASEIKQILGIFACDEDSARCVEWDLNDMTEYSFCGPTGELMYTAYNYGHIPDEEPYWHYYYDKEWNKINDYLLVIYQIDSTVDPEYAETWREEHPDLAEDGIYYRKYTEDGMEELTREEWEEMYETATGYEVDSELIRYEEWRIEKR